MSTRRGSSCATSRSSEDDPVARSRRGEPGGSPDRRRRHWRCCSRRRPGARSPTAWWPSRPRTRCCSRARNSRPGAPPIRRGRIATTGHACVIERRRRHARHHAHAARSASTRSTPRCATSWSRRSRWRQRIPGSRASSGEVRAGRSVRAATSTSSAPARTRPRRIWCGCSAASAARSPSSGSRPSPICTGPAWDRASSSRRSPRTVVAAPDTQIALPEIGLGLVPGAGGTVSLPRRIGRAAHRLAGLLRRDDRRDDGEGMGPGRSDRVLAGEASSCAIRSELGVGSASPPGSTLVCSDFHFRSGTQPRVGSAARPACPRGCRGQRPVSGRREGPSRAVEHPGPAAEQLAALRARSTSSRRTAARI